MKVLHLTPELPYWPGGSGGSGRQFHLLRELVRLGHDVEVVACATSEQLESADSLANAGVAPYIVERTPSRVREAALAIARDPGLTRALWSRPVLAWQTSVFWTYLRPVALERIAKGRPDVVVVEHDWCAAWARDLPSTLPAVLTLHNLSWVYYGNRASVADGLRRRMLRFEARRFLAFDRAENHRYHALATVSQADADVVEAALGREASVIPNGVSLEDAGLAGPEHDQPGVLFTGSMRYPPNEEAVSWFLARIWPIVRTRRPDARLFLAGPGPPDWLRAADGSDGVQVLGRVDSLRPWFDQASVVVAPMLSGGGTRLKVLEALASGRPLVSTRLGAEGVDAVDNRHLVIADEPEAFAAAVVHLLETPARRRELAADGRALVEQGYAYGSIARRLDAVLQGAMSDAQLRVGFPS